jgi:hypothetical protein
VLLLLLGALDGVEGPRDEGLLPGFELSWGLPLLSGACGEWPLGWLVLFP